MFIGQETIYKTDNLVIFIQTLPLALISLNARLLQAAYYQFFIGFHHWLGLFLTAGTGEKCLNILNDGDGYVEYPPTTMQTLVLLDVNIVRHFIVLIILLTIIAVIYFLIASCSLTSPSQSDLEI